MRVARPNTKFNINKLNFTIPLIACAGLGAIGIFAINQDIDETASASNSTTLSSTVSYDDEYITISNSTAVSLGSADVTAADAYVFASDNVTVSTNVATGYDLYISSGNKENSALTTPEYYTEIAATSGTGGDYGTPAVLDANSYGYAVPSGLATNSGFDASYSSPNSGSKFAGVPAGTSDRIHSTTGPNEDGDITDVHYGAYLTNYLAEGTYTGEIVYSAVVTPTRGTVPIEVSPDSGIEGTELTIISGPTNISTSHELATSEVEVYFKQGGITKGTCKVTKVDPSEGHLITTCIVPKLDDGEYDLILNVPRYGFTDTYTSYSANATTLNITMQNMTNSTCLGLTTFNSADIGDTTYIITDSRDNNTYHIRKLADNHCWMVQNLRIMGKTLTTADSDTSSSFTLPSTNSSWCTTSSAACDDTIKVYYSNNTTYGAYYNWYTATTSSGTYSKSSGDTDYSICPKGWKLPYGGYIDYSWYYLYNTGYNANASNFQTATNTGSGYRAGQYNGSLDGTNSTGYWWSRTASTSNVTYGLYITANTIDPRHNTTAFYKYYGSSVRCVFVGS